MSASLIAVAHRARCTRIIPVGMMLLALQKTLFAELQPFGVILQVVLAFAAAAGAAGGPERGAITGFVLGIMFDLTVGSPLGSSAITMGIAGYVAGWVDLIRIDTTWWLAAIFVGVGAGAGRGRACRWSAGSSARRMRSCPTMATIVPVVAVAAAVVSIAARPGRPVVHCKLEQPGVEGAHRWLTSVRSPAPRDRATGRETRRHGR